MAKRFTDTDKWEQEWFTDLSNNEKLIWLYLCDRCDNAGIWHINYKLISFQLNMTVTPDTLKAFGDRIQFIGDKLFITKFIGFQYGEELNPKNKAHSSVIKKMEKLSPLLGPSKPLASPFEGPSSHLYEIPRGLLAPKDKDKDKDKEKDKDKDKEMEERKQFVAECIKDLTTTA